MKIIQFRCPEPPAMQLRQVMVDQVNTWSRLQRLTDDPDYVTAPFTVDGWRVHTTDPDHHWTNWDAIYSTLGDDGRAIADQLLGEGPMQGILRHAPLVAALPDVRLEIVEIEDLVAAGYVEAPNDNTE